MFKPFALTRSSWATLSIVIVPKSDVRFVGRRKEIAVRVRYLSDRFDESDTFWVSPRMSRDLFVRDYVEDRAKSILARLDDRLATECVASQES